MLGWTNDYSCLRVSLKNEIDRKKKIRKMYNEDKILDKEAKIRFSQWKQSIL